MSVIVSVFSRAYACAQRRCLPRVCHCMPHPARARRSRRLRAMLAAAPVLFRACCCTTPYEELLYHNFRKSRFTVLSSLLIIPLYVCACAAMTSQPVMEAISSPIDTTVLASNPMPISAMKKQQRSFRWSGQQDLATPRNGRRSPQLSTYVSH